MSTINLISKNSFLHISGSQTPHTLRRSASCSVLYQISDKDSPIYTMQEAATDRFRERRLSIQSHITGQTVSIDHTDSSAPSVTSVDSASEAPSGVATSVMIRNIPCRYTQTKLVE